MDNISIIIPILKIPQKHIANMKKINNLSLKWILHVQWASWN